MATIRRKSFLCNFYVFLSAVFIIRTAMAQAPAAAPSVPPKVIPTLAPAPAAPPQVSAPAPAPPQVAQILPPVGERSPNIMKILKKAGQFRTLLRLLSNTQVGDQVNGELKDPGNGMTIFAPTDSAFANLPPGAINKLDNRGQVALVQFHVVPTYFSPAQFQAVSNPLHTKAGDVGPYGFPLNVTTNGNATIISSGINNTTIGNPFYNDNQLAIYQLDKVLLPFGLFGPKPPPSAPAPAPAPAAPKKERPSPITTAAPVDISGDVGLRENAVVTLVVAASIIAVFWS